MPKKPLKPLTTKTDRKYGSPTGAQQPPATIHESKPAATVAKAVADSKAQVAKANKAQAGKAK